MSRRGLICTIVNINEVWRHENWHLFGTFFLNQAVWLKSWSNCGVDKLWGGVSSILIKGGSVYPFIDFLMDFYWFLSILLIYWFFIDFIDFYRFLLISIDFIDFSTILSVFIGFFDQFCLFSTYVNKFPPIYRAYVFLKRCVMYNIDQVLFWGSHALCIQPRGCFYSRNTENF